jgi:hypothetical protein
MNADEIEGRGTKTKKKKMNIFIHFFLSSRFFKQKIKIPEGREEIKT